MGLHASHGSGRRRDIVDAIEELIESGALLISFDVGPQRIRRLTYYLYSIDPKLFGDGGNIQEHERTEEPDLELEAIYQQAFALKDKIARRYRGSLACRNFHVHPELSPELGFRGVPKR